MASLSLFVFTNDETQGQIPEFIKTDRSIVSTAGDKSNSPDTNAHDVGNSQQVAKPSVYHYVFDEQYRLETAITENLLSAREQHYVDGLIERGLTQIAEFYCHKCLSFDSLDAAQRAGYARALLQSQKQNLLNASPQNRTAVWLQIEQTCRDTDAIFSGTPFATTSALAYIDIALADMELQLDERDALSQTDKQIAERLAQLIARIDDERQQVAQDMTIVKWLQYRKAVTLRQLARCQPERKSELFAEALSLLQPLITTGSATNVNTLNHAPTTKTSDSVQTELSVFAALEAIACRRTLQQYDEVDTLIASLKTNDFLTPHQRSLLIVAETMAAVDRRDEAGTHAALQTIETAVANCKSLEKTQQIQYGVPELLTARMQGYLFFWKRNLETQASLSHIVGTTTAPNIAACRAMVIETLQRFERDFAPFWRHKIEQTMASQAAFFGNDPVFVELRADAAARKGHIVEAIGYYDALAATLAASEPGEAFRVARKAAELSAFDIDRQRQGIAALSIGTNTEQITAINNREQSLVARLRNLAKSNAKQPDAAETHLTAVYHAARLLQIDAFKVDDYLLLLREHYLTWPQSKQADALRLQAAQLLLNESKFRESLEAIKPVTNRSPVALDVVRTAEQCFDQLRSVEPSVNATVENEAVSWFYNRLLNDAKAITTDWNEADAYCLRCTAKFGLYYANVIERNRTSNVTVDLPAAYRSVERILQIGLAHCPSPTPQWRVEIDSMLLYALAALGQTDQAVQQLQNLNGENGDTLMAALDRLQELADHSPASNRFALGRVRLELIRHIERFWDAADFQQPNPQRIENENRLQIVRADALADTNNVQAALDLLSEMLRVSSGNVEILSASARILSRQDDAKSRDLALRTWRIVEQRTASRSPLWWEAKEAIIRLLVESGEPQQRQEAKAMLEMLLILNPELDGPERKLRLETIIGQ